MLLEIKRDNFYIDKSVNSSGRYNNDIYIYVLLTNKAPKYMKQKLTEIKEIDNQTTNLDKTTMQKINKEI